MHTEISREPELTVASLVHHVVDDLLQQNQFPLNEHPEVVDLAVMMLGLGQLRSQFRFVQQQGPFWDSTYWLENPRPFLDAESMAYTLAIAAWIRDQPDAPWASDLPADIKKPMKKSLRYLYKSGDSFFHPDTAGCSLRERKQAEWLSLAAGKMVSTQVIAVRHLQADPPLRDQQADCLVETLRSTERSLVLNSIRAAESLRLDSQAVTDELRMLAEHRDDEIRAKSVMALTRLEQLDDFTIGCAARMVESRVKYVTFAGVFALASLDQIPETVLRVAERGFQRSLQSCDYEFVKLFAAAFHRWLDNPIEHVQRMLEQDHPEYLEIAVEALRDLREQSAA